MLSTDWNVYMLELEMQHAFYVLEQAQCISELYKGPMFYIVNKRTKTTLQIKKRNLHGFWWHDIASRKVILRYHIDPVPCTVSQLIKLVKNTEGPWILGNPPETDCQLKSCEQVFGETISFAY